MEDVTPQPSASMQVRRRLEQPDWLAIDEVPLTPLEQAYLHQVQIENLLIFTPLLIIAPLAAMLLNLPGSLILALVTALLMLAGIVSYGRYRHALTIAYGVFDHEFIMQKGLIWHKKIALPYTRLQHVSLSQGPLERYFHQHTLKCFSAGSGSAEISLPGLGDDTAEPLRRHLLAKASQKQASQIQASQKQPLTERED
ncbi:PH domain-containing protein [Shewanella sp. JBTF-M18]|uniref:PH domain-containing protein n=1 Tax=Shewanella insulae TaxID=2681496 RepID=A0A6L7I0F7_9GAMM|nr:PH domain-containing protein [Shewanella insulae]MXR69853.1 PH domain-containing protein [Shewanella insulae]